MTDAEADAVQDSIDRLAERFPTLARDHIAQVVREELALLDGSHVRDFISVLAERAASDRLHQEAAPVPPATSDERPPLLRGSVGLDPIEVQHRSEGHSGPLLGG